MIDIKNSIGTLLHRVGWDLRRITPQTNSYYQLLKAIEHFGINHIFDIGGNAGQFAKALRAVGYKEEIVTFEPLSTAHSKLVSAALFDNKWFIHQRTAIGDREGEILINVASNSFSSSVLPMLDLHALSAPGSTYVGIENCPITRLDSVYLQYVKSTSRILVKIDVQGYEWEVLDGASATLERAEGVLCELSLTPLYAGQHLWQCIIKRLEGLGFTLWAIQNGFTDPRDGKTLQVDGLFFRNH